MIPFHPTRILKAIPCVLTLLFILSVPTLASTIEGFVFDSGRNPLADVDMELQNENGQMRGRTSTNGIGRYSFSGLADGRYYIVALPFRYNLKKDKHEVTVNTFSLIGAGNVTIQDDFTLYPRPGGLADTTTGVVFAQNIPDDAKERYKESQKALKDKDKQLYITKLVAAIKAFPEYYQALNDLGIALLGRERYLDAAQVFLKAASVNPKSSKAFYYAGAALANVGKDYLPAARVSFTKAEELAPNSYEIAFELGKTEKKLKNFTAAEEKLLRAKKLVTEGTDDDRRAEIHLFLAQLYSDDLKQYDKAADELSMYIKLSKNKDLEPKVVELRKKAKRT